MLIISGLCACSLIKKSSHTAFWTGGATLKTLLFRLKCGLFAPMAWSNGAEWVVKVKRPLRSDAAFPKEPLWRRQASSKESFPKIQKQLHEWDVRLKGKLAGRKCRKARRLVDPKRFEFTLQQKGQTWVRWGFQVAALLRCSRGGFIETDLVSCCHLSSQ